MENFEISDSFVGITQIWEVFFLPIVSTSIIILFLYILLGKQYIYDIYQKYKLIKVDNKYYRQKHIKMKRGCSNANKNNRVILLPLSEMSINVITWVRNPIIFIVVFLMVVYTIYKMINLCSSLYPIRYSISGEAMLLYFVPKEIITEIWTYFPEYTLLSLYQKINILGEECSYAKYTDYTNVHIFGSIFEMCSIFCVISLFLQKPNIKKYIKTLFLLWVSLFAIFLSFYLQFQKAGKVLEQKAYYVREQLILDNPSVADEYYTYQLAVEKVENEIRYRDSKIFYGAFGVRFEL